MCTQVNSAECEHPTVANRTSTRDGHSMQMEQLPVRVRRKPFFISIKADAAVN